MARDGDGDCADGLTGPRLIVSREDVLGLRTTDQAWMRLSEWAAEDEALASSRHRGGRDLLCADDDPAGRVERLLVHVARFGNPTENFLFVFAGLVTGFGLMFSLMHPAGFARYMSAWNL